MSTTRDCGALGFQVTVPMGRERLSAALEDYALPARRLAPIPTGIEKLLDGWMNAVEMLRFAEVIRIRDSSFDSKRTEHKIACEQLIADGGKFIQLIKAAGEIQALPYTLEDVEATLESLQDSYRVVHHPTLTAGDRDKLAMILDEPEYQD